MEPDKRLTHSRMATAKSCLRKHQYRYELGIRGIKEAKALRMGTAFHRGREYGWTMTPDEAIVKAITKSYDGVSRGDTTPGEDYAWQLEREIVARLLSGYFWRWADTDASEFEVVSTEKNFEVPLRNPATGKSTPSFTLAGKRDAILISRTDGRRILYEMKSTSDPVEPDGDFWLVLVIEAQLSTYYIAADAEGQPCETALYDVIRKPSIRPRLIPLLDDDKCKIVRDEVGQRIYNKPTKAQEKAGEKGKPRQSANIENGWVLETRPETIDEYGTRLTADIGDQPERYYARREVPRLQADLDEHAFELWQYQQLLRECQRESRWPKTTSQCLAFGRCEFFNLCTGGFDVAEFESTRMLPDGFMLADTVHPELA